MLSRCFRSNSFSAKRHVLQELKTERVVWIIETVRCVPVTMTPQRQQLWLHSNTHSTVNTKSRVFVSYIVIYRPI